MTWHGTNSPYAYIVLGASPQIDIGYHNISLAWFSILVNETKNVGGSHCLASTTEDKSR